MSRFREELRVIPRIAQILGWLIYLGLGTLAFTVLVPRDPEMRSWNVGWQLLFCYGIMSFLLAFVWLIGYVYGDAKRRGMRYVMWTLLAVFIPYAIGIILYFLLRSPLPKPCPGCSQFVSAGFVFCPHCGTSLQATCSNCGRAAEPGWSNCPACGTKLQLARIA